MTFTPSNRVGSLISSRLPSARTALLAVSHASPSPSATRATVRCATTIPSSAHRSPVRESFARGSAAALVSWRPHVSAVGTAVAAHYNFQHGRSPAQRLVGQPPDHGVTSSAFAAAPSAPLIWFHHAAREDRTIRFKSLSGHAQTEAVESSEGGQVRAAEAGRRGSVGHVEVFRMDGVGTSVVGRPRRLSADRRARPTYTVI